MKGTDHFKRTIQMYLEQRAEEDTLFAKKYRNPAKYIYIVLLKWSVPFISLSFLDYLFQYLSPIGRLYLAEKEVHEIPPCVLVQFVVQSSESFKIAVDVRFHHIHEDVVHLVISALLRYRLAVSLCHVGKG